MVASPSNKLMTKELNKFQTINSIKIRKKSNKKILLVDRGRYYQTHLSLTLAKGLSEKFDYEVGVLLNNSKNQEIKKFYQCYEIENFYSVGNFQKLLFFFPTCVIFFFSILNLFFKGTDWFINNYSFKKILLGPAIWDFYIRRDLSFLQRKLNFKLSKIIFICILKTFYLENFIKRNNFKCIIVNSTSYISNSSLLLRLCIKNKITVYFQTVSGIHKLSRLNQIDINTLDISKIKLKKLFNQKRDLKKIDKFLKDRFKGKFSNKNILDSKFSVAAYRKKKISSIKELNHYLRKKNINIKNYKNIYFFAPHCFSDSNHLFGKFIFSDFYDQFVSTFQFIKNDEKNFWFIKSHPHTTFYGEEKFLDNFFKTNKKKNIFFINSQSNISTKCLIDYSDLVITTGGTVGLESACLGKKSLITNKTYYSSFGLTLNPKNKNEYFNILKNFNKKKLSKKSISIAKKLLYWSTIGRGFEVYSPKNDNVKNNLKSLLMDFIVNKKKFNKKNLDYITNIKKNL